MELSTKGIYFKAAHARATAVPSGFFIKIESKRWPPSHDSNNLLHLKG